MKSAKHTHKAFDGTKEVKGVELMKEFFWDFVSDPHMMVVGGTGGVRRYSCERLSLPWPR